MRQTPARNGTREGSRQATAIAPGQRAAHPWLTLCTVALGLMMVLLDTSIVSVANATIGKDLHGSLASLQWVTDAFLLAIATGLVAGGKLGDHYGRRRLFSWGAAGFALTSAGCGLSVSMAMLIGFRAAQGLAGAAMMPQTLATLRATFGRRFHLAVGIYVGLSSLAIASGPIVGGALVQAAGWRSIFFINVVVGAAVITAARAFVPETRSPRAAALDVPGALLLAGALFCLAWALVNSGTHPWSSAYTLGFLAAAAVLAVLWAARMARAAAPLVPLSLFRAASFDAGAGVVTATGFTMYGLLFYLTLYLQRVHGDSPVAAGAALLPLTAASGIAAPLGGALARRIPLRAQLCAGLLLVTAGTLGLATLGARTATLTLAPWLALAGIGLGISLTGGSQAVVGSAPPAHAGIATGIQQTSLNIGGALATAVLGSVMVSRTGTVLPGLLARQHVPAGLTASLTAARTAIAQGLIPLPAGLTGHQARAVTMASQQAMTSGLRTALFVIAAVTAAASLAAVSLITSGAHPAPGDAGSGGPPG
jgi:EmrB/QacA subfamily drug resistance transporter